MASIFEYSRYKNMYSKLGENYISRVHISVTNYMSMKRNKVMNMKELYREEKKAYDDIPYTEPQPLRKLVTTSHQECSYLNLIPSPWSKKCCQQQ